MLLKPLCRAIQRCSSTTVLSSAMFLVAAPLTHQVQAFTFTPSDDVQVAWDTTLTYGVMYRLEDQDDTLLSDINVDDGNRSFDKGLVSNRLSFTTEADINVANDHGLFIRARGWYDDLYQQSNDNQSDTSNSRSVASNRFNSTTKEAHGKDAELLDYFVYTGFDMGEKRLNLRVGNQVVSWGESLFLQGGVSSSQGAVDATKSNIPGVELKDIFLPVKQVFLQADLSSNLSAGAYYQFEWSRNRLDEAGSYLSVDDYLDQGGESFLAPSQLGAFGLPAYMTIDRSKDNKPKDSGQFGFALRYLVEELNDTEFGVYYTRSHDKNPMVKTRFGTGGQADFDWASMAGAIDPVAGEGTAVLLQAVEGSSYYLDYAENIDLLGVSASGVIGSTNVAAELTYRDGIPTQMVSTDPTSLLGFDYKRVDVAQLQVSAMHVFGPTPLADGMTLMAEVGANQVLGEKSSELLKDKSAWGYSAQLELDYFAVLPGLDLTIPLQIKQGVKGNSSMAGTFTEGADSFAVGTDFTYLQNARVGLKYVNYFGRASENPLLDRDFVAINVKYTF